MVLAALSWAVFAVLSTLVMRPFVRLSAIGHAGGNRLRRDLWPHRLHRQSRRLPRGYLVEGASGGLQTCIVPLLSYNCAAQKYARCRETVHKSPLISASLMLVGAACFILLPGALAALAHRSELHMARLSRRGDGRGGARLHHVPQTAEGVEISHMEKASPFPCEKVSQSLRCRSAANKILSVFHGGVYVVKNTLRVAQCRSLAACGGVRHGAE